MESPQFPRSPQSPQSSQPSQPSQPSASPQSRPPIPTPDGRIAPAPPPLPVTAAAGDWKNAPGIVRGWAYPLTWLAMLGFVLLIVVSFLSDTDSDATKVGMAIFYAVLLGFQVWLNRALKNGTRGAWLAQAIWSVFGLLGFPVGTLIHGYILSQWFKPETKAWFGRS